MAAPAGVVTVITSFPKEVTDIYKKEFERLHPEIRISILNKNTNAALIYIERTPRGQRPDVFWASAPDAFEVMARNDLLEPLPDVKNPAAPSRIGAYPINDERHRYFGQALSGYGIMWNLRYLAAHHLTPPANWSDLTRAEYFGHIALSSPSWSGTTHLMVESILQGAGWDEGWSQLMQIAANSAAITERSFGVPEGVNAGRYGVGMVIDFFAFVGKRSGFPVDFTYPDINNLIPASIGVIAGARNHAEARSFVAFTLSDQGQRLLLDPRISRMPVVPYDTLQGKVAAGYPRLPDTVTRSSRSFDAALAQDRIRLVTAMFDQTITFPIRELRTVAREIFNAERLLAQRPDAQAAELIAQARRLAFTPVVAKRDLGDAGLRSTFYGRGDGDPSEPLARSTQQSIALERGWNTHARAAYAQAIALARQASARLDK
ncbi:ABC transporter substrate-binding protein [Herbaspirillum sp. YR522]|uniref:ABC transporter substrate-binding protein n=1 Tax=Herbaspirillum sp. YR522 TaxID=1144342 RepID=UPI00026FBC13|nr:extracellular solute-binding protein [Herbaspirillum sp. YR522]EJN07749.1 ABC-type Fe3+ transport system, periplasmic component [Herbaspirillum sp. YR522]